MGWLFLHLITRPEDFDTIGDPCPLTPPAPAKSCIPTYWLLRLVRSIELEYIVSGYLFHGLDLRISLNPKPL